MVRRQPSFNWPKFCFAEEYPSLCLISFCCVKWGAPPGLADRRTFVCLRVGLVGPGVFNTRSGQFFDQGPEVLRLKGARESDTELSRKNDLARRREGSDLRRSRRKLPRRRSPGSLMDLNNSYGGICTCIGVDFAHATGPASSLFG